MPTVSRQVSALIDLRLLCELPTSTADGGVGRPTVPVGVDDEVVAACGVHIGVTTTTYGLANLRGEVLDSGRLATPGGDAVDALEAIAERVGEFVAAYPDRRVIGLGVATGGDVDNVAGVVTHARLGWDDVPARAVLERATGLRVQLDGHVPAMAVAELLFGEAAEGNSALYFYAREMVGTAIAVNGRLHRGPAGGAGVVAHLPVGGDVPCPCGRTGCLEVSVAERWVAQRAVREGVIAEPDIALLHAAADDGDVVAAKLLTERARTLGRAAGILRDLVNPDAVILAGQAVTDAPGYLDELLDSFAETTTLPGKAVVEVTRFGHDVQAVAACAGLLARLYERPISF